MERRKNGVMLFCECSSIRGMPKIARSSSKFLRKMWLAFVVGMSLALIVSVSFSVHRYLNYDVIVHISDKQKFNSKFPAITVCLHQPFSRSAFPLWSNKSVMSPRSYNRLLRDLALKAINRTGDFSAISNDNMDPIEYALYYDSVEVYYQNIPYESIIRLSHAQSVIRKCIVRQMGVIFFKDPCDLSEHGFDIKLFSHPKHLNCYTVEPREQKTSLETYSLGLAVDLGPKPDYANHQQGFLNDVFDQAAGLRVVIHEPNRYPDVEHQGMNIEAGKMTELAYTPTIWNRSNTPVNPCIEGEGESYMDLGRNFDYSQKECIKLNRQQLVMENCNCILGVPGYPRPRVPTKENAYCAAFSEAFNKTFKDFIDRVSCVGEIMSRPEPPCLSRCVLFEYETKISVTEWGATDWQVDWSGRYVNDIETLVKLIEARETTPEDSRSPGWRKNFDNVKQRLLRYLEEDNLTSTAQTNDRMLESKSFAYVLLKRKGDNLILKEEKQVLTLNALMSQIGGLCSLTIGLTCAVAVEIVEFVYIYLTSRRNDSTENSANATAAAAVTTAAATAESQAAAAATSMSADAMRLRAANSGSDGDDMDVDADGDGSDQLPMNCHRRADVSRL
ncbi:hypothetical protein BOX15_Mlig022931g1 [Macrostomum lignano]|uniref:FMRFamide-activated amiloride-sensitive sodium channel n=1 Tax=Macrostomum lignano TaxID=282301 RepID=A0A267DUE3_9PLAT|nr:hypothetical protein BOX15_Mlig022931g2 [Macrostomum lignano]PAA52865.1 hypothetical protein BOX15_Mlig022931g1 [Macrostomum lignano]